MELVQLRFRAVCKTCHSKLPPRSEAYQDAASGDTICPTCYRAAAGSTSPSSPAPAAWRPSLQDGAPPAAAPAAPPPAEPAPVVGAPASARSASPAPEAPTVEPPATDGAPAPGGRPRPRKAPAKKLPAAHPAPVSEPDPGFGPLKPTPAVGPLSAMAPKKPKALPVVGPSLAAGAVVEKEAEGGGSPIRRTLEAASQHGLEILVSRPWMGTAVDSELIVVAPSGVWVVDGLSEADAPYDRAMLSGHAGADLFNVVGGKVSVISGLLFDSEFQWLPVRGALCFEGRPPSWFDARFTVAGIAITTPRDLIDMLFSPIRADDDTRAAVAAHISKRS